MRDSSCVHEARGTEQLDACLLSHNLKKFAVEANVLIHVKGDQDITDI